LRVDLGDDEVDAVGPDVDGAEAQLLADGLRGRREFGAADAGGRRGAQPGPSRVAVRA
jgi:hypothetical protein